MVTDPIYQEIIMEALAPYRRLLQVGGSMFEGGAQRKLRYDDILNESYIYNKRMNNLDYHVYNKLKYKNVYKMNNHNYQHNDIL